MTISDKITVKEISSVIGAEVKGIDLKKPQSSEVAAMLNQALSEHCVLVFRNQHDVTDEEQMQFGSCFGNVVMRRPRQPSGKTSGNDPDSPIMMVSNIVEKGKSVGAFGDGEMWFHHDMIYTPEPHRATALYSLQLPSWGGNTCFSNMYKAFDAIPKVLRDKLEGKRVLQMHDYKRRERIDVESVDLSQILHHWQPIFITHPNTGRRALYVNRLMSAQIEGYSVKESHKILDELCDIAESPEFTMEHEWELGDMVIWDNWCSMHARKDFPKDESRLLRRITIEGQSMTF